MSKFEKLLDLLVNENKDEAEKLFHEIVVEKSREIYEGILAEDEKSEDDEVTETEQSSDKAEDDEVAETKEEDSEEAVEETEEPAEATEETVEEIGGDQTDDLLSDIEAEAHGMDGMDMPGEEGDEEGEEAGEEGEAEEMFEPLEKELDALKAEFAKMMDEKDEEPEEESVEPEFEATEETEETVESEEAEEVEESTEKKDADTLIKEYSEQMKADLADHADGKKSPVAGKNDMGGSAVKMDQGGEEKGGKPAAPKEESAGNVNVPGGKASKLEAAPKAETSEKSADKHSPVAKS